MSVLAPTADIRCGAFLSTRRRAASFICNLRRTLVVTLQGFRFVIRVYEGFLCGIPGEKSNSLEAQLSCPVERRLLPCRSTTKLKHLQGARSGN